MYDTEYIPMLILILLRESDEDDGHTQHLFCFRDTCKIKIGARIK